MASLRQRIQSRLASPYLLNAGWLGSAELANRVFRLGTTVILARFLTPNDYGLLAILFTVQSFSEVFTAGVGTGAKIIQVEQDALPATCATAYWINWMLGGSICIIQCLLAFPISWIYHDQQLILPICVLAAKYLLIPIYKVQGSLIKRENRLKITAFAAALESLLSNLLTIALVLLGFGIWSVIWAMMLSVVVPMAVSYRYHPWRPNRTVDLSEWRPILKFSSDVLGVRLLDRLRLNLDYMIVGKMLGVDALGLYFFSFNAGIGISQNVINVFTSSLFPYLCEVQTNLELIRKRYFKSLQVTLLCVIPIVLLQSLAAPIYVPLIFGSQWVDAVPILQLVCLSAIPVAVYMTVTQLLNARDLTRLNLIWSMIYTVLFGCAIFVAAPFGLLAVAIAVLIIQTLTLAFSAFALRKALYRTPEGSRTR